MKRLILALCVVTRAACTTMQPVQYSRLASADREPTFDCALSYANSLGYTVVDANKDAGFFRVEKKTTGTGQEVAAAIFGGGAHKYDAMTVSVFNDPSTGAATLKVTATTLNEPIGPLAGGQPRSQNKPSVKLIADTQKIFTECTGGPAPNPLATPGTRQ